MSIWENISKEKKYPKLQENKAFDILIIGGGMTGLNSLYYLKGQKSICLVEGKEIGCGVSKNTTGKINYLQENTLAYFIVKEQNQTAHQYLKSQLEGINLLKNIIEKEQIACDFERVCSYLVTQKESKIKDLEKIHQFLEKENLKVSFDLPQNTKDFLKGIKVEDTYVFNPLKYMTKLAEKMSNLIYENTRIINIKKEQNEYSCLTNDGYIIKAKKVIIACHYPFFLFPFFLPIQTSIEKSYIIAKEVPENLKYTYITLEKPSISSRFCKKDGKIYQLFLAKSHSTSIFQNDLQNFCDTQNIFSITNAKIEYCWSNMDILSFDHLPFIGEIKENLYIATAFQAWGMINSTLSAKIVSNLIKKEPSKYTELFSPKRKQIKKIIASSYYLGLNAFSFARSKFIKKNWYSNHLIFFWKNGKKIACYQDENQKKHYVYPVCPHLKCGLIFNEVEKTWDCPCHSSRFDLDGKIIKGPAKYSITIKNLEKEE